VPFDGLVIFSTNLTPTELADEGLLRRLHYKIEVADPSKEDYARIWARLCDERGIGLPHDLLPFLEDAFYARGTIPRAGYHPRYLVDQVAAMCEYAGRPLQLDKALLRLAWSNLFAH
jgi:hypothetical protein